MQRIINLIRNRAVFILLGILILCIIIAIIAAFSIASRETPEKAVFVLYPLNLLEIF